MIRNERRIAMLSAWLSMLLFSATPVLIKAVPLDPGSYNFARSLVAFVLVSFFYRPQKTGEIKSPAILVTCVIFGACSNICFVIAGKATDTTSLVGLAYLSPLLVPLVAWIWFRTRTSKLDIALVVFAAIGMLLIFVDKLGHASLAVRGNLYAIGSAATWAVYLCGAARIKGGITVAFYTNLANTVFCLPLIQPGQYLDLTWAQTAMIVGNGVALGGALLLLNVALKSMKPTRVGLITSVEVGVAPLLTWIALHEIPSPMVIVGAFVVLLAVVGCLIFKDEDQPPEKPA